MRLRLAVPASLLAALALVVLPTVGSAAPSHNHGLTINATPNPILSGDAVLIYGQLNTNHPGNKLIVLYHRVNPQKSFSPIQTVKTNATGFYEFTRAEDVVTTNRSWFVVGPNGTHSRTVHEKVMAQVTLTASSVNGDTNHVLTFSGHVDPNHAGERVILQSQQGLKGDDWRDIASGKLGPGSNFVIKHKFAQPGERDLRVLFRGDDRNVRSVSNPITVTIQQTENPAFTINSSSPNIDEGASVTISGVLYKKGSTSVPDGGQVVQLWGHDANHKYALIEQTTSDSTTGAYSFSEKPTFNEVYQARTVASTTTKVRRTAQLFEGVRDVVTINPVAPNALVGQKVTFTGTVQPDKTGHVIYLQRLGADNDWHTVKESHVLVGSTYSIDWTFGTPGKKVFRTLVPGGEFNATGHSAPVTITVTLPAVQSLPTAS